MNSVSERVKSGHFKCRGIVNYCMRRQQSFWGHFETASRAECTIEGQYQVVHVCMWMICIGVR